MSSSSSPYRSPTSSGCRPTAARTYPLRSVHLRFCAQAFGVDRHGHDPLPFALANQPRGIAIQIHLAVEVETTRVLQGHLHGFTVTLVRIAPTSSMPRRNTPAYSAISAAA
jgi:hypothetical protein